MELSKNWNPPWRKCGRSFFIHRSLTKINYIFDLIILKVILQNLIWFEDFYPLIFTPIIVFISLSCNIIYLKFCHLSRTTAMKFWRTVLTLMYFKDSKWKIKPCFFHRISMDDLPVCRIFLYFFFPPSL